MPVKRMSPGQTVSCGMLPPRRLIAKPMEGVEPSTPALRKPCSAIELHRRAAFRWPQSRDFTNDGAMNQERGRDSGPPVRQCCGTFRYPSQYMSNRTGLAIGIDIGGTDTKVGIADASYELLASARVSTLPDQRVEALAARVVDLCRKLLKANGLTESDVVAVGIGAPGIMDHAAGQVVRSPNLPLWHHASLCELFSNALGKPSILENDANVAAWGEHVAGSGRGSRNMAMLTLGTGLGGGIVLNGKVLHGSHGSAGELGHTILVPDGHLCGCGQKGCLEQYVSATALERTYSELARATQNAEAGIDAEAISSRVESDPIARQAWDQMCRRLALACLNLSRLLDIDRIVLGGGVSNAGERLLAPTRSHYAAMDWKMSPYRPELVIAQLGNDAGMVGAAALAQAAARSADG